MSQLNTQAEQRQVDGVGGRDGAGAFSSCHRANLSSSQSVSQSVRLRVYKQRSWTWNGERAINQRNISAALYSLGAVRCQVVASVYYNMNISSHLYSHNQGKRRGRDSKRRSRVLDYKLTIYLYLKMDTPSARRWYWTHEIMMQVESERSESVNYCATIRG